MHSYAVDFAERRVVPFYLAIGSTGCTLGLRELLKLLGFDGGAGVYVPSGFAFYGLLFLLFDGFLWKWGLLWQLGQIKTPNLAGTYKGELRSSHSEQQKKHEIIVKITQSWTTIIVILELADRSHSHSEMAWIKSVSPTEFELRCEYFAEANDPNYAKFNHRGVTRLRLNLQRNTVVPQMTGDYYTQRQTYGTIYLTRDDNGKPST